MSKTLLQVITEQANAAVAAREERLTVNDPTAEAALVAAAREKRIVSFAFCEVFRDEAAIVLDTGEMFILSAKAGIMVHQHHGERLVCPACAMQVSEHFDKWTCPHCGTLMEMRLC